MVLRGLEELARDERKKLVPPVGRTSFSHFREQQCGGPFEGSSPLGGRNVRFRLG